MIEYRLSRANRLQLARALHDVKRADIGIDCAIEGQMGQAFVDDPEYPLAFKIEQGPFCYFAGAPDSPGALEMIKVLPSHALMMPSSPGWVELARSVHGRRLHEFPRYSFSSAGLSLEHLGQVSSRLGLAKQIQPLDEALASQVWEGHRFIDLSMFDSARDFLERGIGFCMLDGSTIIGAAYSSLVCSKGIEVSLFVDEAHRRRGIGSALSSELLAECLQQGMDAHWDAANTESCRIAERLGYTHMEPYQAYWVDQEGGGR